MDQLDKKLYTDLNNEIDIPDELDTIIKNGLKGKKKHSSLMKKVASFFCYNFYIFKHSFCHNKYYAREKKRMGRTRKSGCRFY